MEIRGAKGFKGTKYKPRLIAEYLLENLLGVNRMRQMSFQEKKDYVTEQYPVVMSFFRQHDLQPTLMNIRLNKDALISLTSDEAGEMPAPEAEGVPGLFDVPGSDASYTGDLEESYSPSPLVAAAVLVLLLLAFIKLIN